MTWRKSSFSASETDCVEVAWRKITFSASQSDCVEVTWPATGVAIRDSKNPTGPVLLIGDRARAALLATFKP